MQRRLAVFPLLAVWFLSEYLDAVRRAARRIAADSEPRVILTSSLVFNNNGFCGANGEDS